MYNERDSLTLFELACCQNQSMKIHQSVKKFLIYFRMTLDFINCIASVI